MRVWLKRCGRCGPSGCFIEASGVMCVDDPTRKNAANCFSQLFYVYITCATDGEARPRAGGDHHHTPRGHLCAKERMAGNRYQWMKG